MYRNYNFGVKYLNVHFHGTARTARKVASDEERNRDFSLCVEPARGERFIVNAIRIKMEIVCISFRQRDKSKSASHAYKFTRIELTFLSVSFSFPQRHPTNASPFCRKKRKRKKKEDTSPTSSKHNENASVGE